MLQKISIALQLAIVALLAALVLKPGAATTAPTNVSGVENNTAISAAQARAATDLLYAICVRLEPAEKPLFGLPECSRPPLQ